MHFNYKIHCFHQDDEKCVRILVNVTYSYAIIERAARAIQESDRWLYDENIQKLKFSKRWVKSFLTRGGLSRRIQTLYRSEDKLCPE